MYLCSTFPNLSCPSYRSSSAWWGGMAGGWGERGGWNLSSKETQAKGASGFVILQAKGSSQWSDAYFVSWGRCRLPGRADCFSCVINSSGHLLAVLSTVGLIIKCRLGGGVRQHMSCSCLESQGVNGHVVCVGGWAERGSCDSNQFSCRKCDCSSFLFLVRIIKQVASLLF